MDITNLELISQTTCHSVFFFVRLHSSVDSLEPAMVVRWWYDVVQVLRMHVISLYYYEIPLQSN